jgi:Putative transposase
MPGTLVAYGLLPIQFLFPKIPQRSRHRPVFFLRVRRSNVSVFDGQCVSFRWRDYVTSKRQRVTLSAAFLRGYIQHVLPHRFVRNRQFGFLANSQRRLSPIACGL